MRKDANVVDVWLKFQRRDSPNSRNAGAPTAHP